MANIVASVGSLVEAGMKGLRELADGYYGEEGEGEAEEVDREAVPVTQPVSIQSRRSSDFSSTPSSSSNQSSVFSRAPSHPCELVEAVDVPSGWIHLQSTYLDGTGGQRKVRSFGLRNVTERKVEVEIGSDLGGQLMFWAGEDDRRECPVIPREVEF